MKLLTAALLMAVTLAGCGYQPSTAECFSFAPTDGPCTFTPVNSEHWKVVSYDD
ncbi:MULTISPECIES: hypothetical protein [Rhodobacterales]|uniref:Lipoprotein n=1 Tax=Allosediminivita pacifica TaxID=1267769 RepID=A0A2T6ADL9_9RHOB|nr:MULTISPECIES: hypothetical protein [Rhodobacterales]PTX41908.1 hypothetical protein C8N44_12675 [Allosediminivita pacifica]GGB30013.1 hypothetical protein GCM10011324_44420 [Allosediminivita pacifica]|tara:strand:- start:201 stop:362 length:162 start_codon:yes stop_codon:yes gene_type:complete